MDREGLTKYLFGDESATKPITSTRTVHVNFCNVCHYVWKAPAKGLKCVNCKNEDTVQSLASYETEVPVA